MLLYIIKRLLLFIPTLLVVSLIAFLISIHAPGDPTDQLAAEQSSGADQVTLRKLKLDIRERLGLNLPVFYLSLVTQADIDTVYRITDSDQRDMLVRLTRHSGQPDLTMQWFAQVMHTDSIAQAFNPQSVNLSSPGYLAQVDRIRSLLRQISRTSDHEIRQQRGDTLETLLSTTSGMIEVRNSWKKCLELHTQLEAERIWWKQWIPAFNFHGSQNRYHRWLFGNGDDMQGILRGDFGVSYRDGRKIFDIILPKIKWSLTIALGSLLLAWLISIPVGLFAAYRIGGWFDRISGALVFLFWSVPGFFLGTLLLLWFANPDFLDWFPSGGVKDPATFDPEWPLHQRLAHYIPYLVLPVLTYTLGALAFISRQIRAGIRREMQKDYIRTARAKGLSERRIIVVHAFRNTLIPLITIMGQYLPLLFAGSIVIESIFSIPGMGLEIYESIITNDYPMIVTLFTLFGFLTMLGFLLADIGYALADPRVHYSGTKE